MKKLVSKCLFIMLFFVFLPNTVYAVEETQSTSDGFVYRYFDEEQNSIEIVGYEGDETRITIPSEIESLPVITIGEEAFCYNESIEEVLFEGNVESIGLEAFYECENLKSVTFCDSIKDISAKAFAYCYNLEGIVFPEGLIEIGDNSFVETAITSITIPESVSLLGNNVFGACNNLLSIEVVSSNQDYSSVDGVLYNKDQTKLMCCPAGKSSVHIADTVVQIDQRAFYFAEEINEINLPKSLGRIGDEAFFGTSISQITIPKEVSFIGEYAFYACIELLNINVESENKVYASENGVLYNKQKTKLICCPSQKEEMDIPNTVTEIGIAAFGCCDRLTMLIIPDSVTTIGEEAFAWAENLSYLYVPDSVVEIGRAAFSDVLRIDCNAKSVAEEYAIENEINYTIHSHTLEGGQVCIICGKVVPLATGKFALLKKFLQEKGQIDDNGDKYFHDMTMVSDTVGAIAIITYLEDEAKFQFSYGNLENNRVTSTIAMLIGENGSQTVTVDYNHVAFSLDASATFDVRHYARGGKEYFEKTSSNILENSQIQDICNATLKAAFTGWDMLFLRYFGFDVNMADMGFSSYEEAGTHTWDSGYVTKAATNTSEGEKTYTCVVCDATRTEIIPKLKESTVKPSSVTTRKSQNIQVVTNKKISAKKVAKKAQSFKLNAQATSGNKVNYRLLTKNKNIKFNASSGKITVKKGTKKGTYKIKVRMTVSENDMYYAYSVTKTIKIKVK